MSPEQAAGTQRLDARTDVFGLACVVYELVVGETPEMWSTEQAVRLGRFVDASPAHAGRLDRLPGHFQQTLVRALAVRPADRYASPLEFVAALRVSAGHTPALRDDDVHAVLRRAAELQLAHPTEDPALSVGAVEQIAAEVGIPPEHVRAALREREPAAAPPAEPTRSRGRLFDRPRPPGAEVGFVFDIHQKTARVERVVDREATPAEFPALVTEIHEALGLAGHASILGPSLTWSPAGQGPEGRNVLVTVTAREGRSVVRVEERMALTGFWQAAPGIAGAGGAMLGMLLGMGLGGGEGPHMIVPALLLAAGSAYIAARGLLTTKANVAQPQLVALADRLAQLLAGAAIASRPAGALPSPDTEASA
jgi:hypothetical protein